MTKVGRFGWLSGAVLLLVMLFAAQIMVTQSQGTQQPTPPATTAGGTGGSGSLPIGNNFPAGPAPTALPGNLVQSALQVSEGLTTGPFASKRALMLPQGFSISVYAALSGHVRKMAFSPDNVLFVTEQQGGNVIRITDNNGVGKSNVWSSGLDQPHGIAFHQDGGQTYLYVAEFRRIIRYAYQPGQQQGNEAQVIVSDLPSSNDHVTRTIVFGTDGKMYVSLGSGCNVCVEDEPRRAAVMQFNADGTNGRVYSSGLRNGVGLAVHPATGEIWEVENGRDQLGDNLPPEEINVLSDGGNYGWPYCYSNKVWDSNFAQRDQAFCDTTLSPILPMQAHSAPLGIAFYTGSQFPSDYQGDAFVAFHGSWNRTVKTGYKVVRVHIQNNRPVSYEDFLTGFLVDQAAWGRPVDVIVGQDGTLYLSDDTANAVYKITYGG